jgi:hypothetical protein
MSCFRRCRNAEFKFVLNLAARRFPTSHRTKETWRTHTSFGSLKQIDASLLNFGYAEVGPADGPAVILLHGWLRHSQLC